MLKNEKLNTSKSNFKVEGMDSESSISSFDSSGLEDNSN